MLEGLVESWIYAKKAVGKEGIPFVTYKVRTMEPNADSQRAEALMNGHDDFGKPKDDPRVIHSRRFLRKHFIDEIPGLYNVIRGEMKLVGIRPVSEQELQEHPERIQNIILSMRPGFAGIDYAHEPRGYKGHLAKMRLYAREHAKNPLRTDLIYGLRIAYNIIVKGVRSL